MKKGTLVHHPRFGYGVTNHNCGTSKLERVDVVFTRGVKTVLVAMLKRQPLEPYL